MPMTVRSRTPEQVDAAMRMVEEAQGTPVEKAEMLMEIAMSLQQKPKEASDIEAAVTLYETALGLNMKDLPLLSARIRARMATALMIIPSEDTLPLERARDELETALGTLTAEGSDEEIAEAEMNLGLVLQNLAPFHKARIQDSISAYQRALRTFDKKAHPKEFAILQNNLATAFLSIPFTDEKAKMREALAVQAFEEGLSVVTLIDHPSEYAMLQNNLGNALQYVSSSHRVENGFRALDAYDEALKVRERRNAPGEYANTIANKANCLANLPDDPEEPDKGNPRNLSTAWTLYGEARDIFRQLGDLQKAEAVGEALRELEEDLPSVPLKANGAH
jgi:tetratricopeptide (TPR) repeat protein